MTAAPWSIVERTGSAATLHALEPTTPVGRIAWTMTLTSPALVLGSTQRDDVVRVDRLRERGIDLARRRSGGSAVLLVPDEVVWVDLVLPRTDVLVHRDVGHSFRWVGDLWAAALGDLGLEAAVHAGPMERSAWSSLVCFAGIGEGEVSVDGRKVVGLSQRRTREWVRFQCLAYRQLCIGDLVELLDDEGLALVESPGSVAAGAIDVAPDALLERVLAHLPV